MARDQKSSIILKTCNTPFQSEHVIEYALEITQRDPKTLNICSVRYQFCSYFDREEIVGQNIKDGILTNYADILNDSSVWAFSFTNNSSTHYGRSYFDNRIRFHRNGVL